MGGAGFNEDGTFSLSYLDFRTVYGDNIKFKYDHFSGRYKIKNGIIFFELNEQMLSRRTLSEIDNREVYEDRLNFTGYLNEEGYLMIEIFDYPITHWMDEFSA